MGTCEKDEDECQTRSTTEITVYITCQDGGNYVLFCVVEESWTRVGFNVGPAS